MGSKNKLKRFNENLTFPNVIQPDRKILESDSFIYKGKWKENYFNNENDIILELGCGKGEYVISLAKENPNKNFIGIDIKGARFWRGAKTAIEENISNVSFVRVKIEMILAIFSENEINEIWLTFPDPQIKHKRTKLRLINPEFLEKYKFILAPMGLVNLKTDSEFLYGYTLGLLENISCTIKHIHHDIYNNSNSPSRVINIQTFYEKKFLKENKSIKYIQFYWNEY
ncbi:MAG: tRNA (guanosine(46)-N7)-methyltransferase TrmB [Flavobacteriaceae bacterium]|nr:tRNA (guanosine(46)-N7)-methyltransferase TrmB [Flavobacteriaceae bacterium]